MEIRFINEYKLNRKLIKEYVYNVLCKNIIITGYALTIISLILFFVNKETNLVMLTIFFISLITTTLTPILTSNQIEENSKKLNNGKIEKTIIKFSNNIVMDEGKAHIEFDYKQIKKITETKNFLVLSLSKQSAILVLKQGFTKNDNQNFLKFIKQKIGE